MEIIKTTCEGRFFVFGWGEEKIVASMVENRNGKEKVEMENGKWGLHDASLLQGVMECRVRDWSEVRGLHCAGALVEGDLVLWIRVGENGDFVLYW